MTEWLAVDEDEEGNIVVPFCPIRIDMPYQECITSNCRYFEKVTGDDLDVEAYTFPTIVCKWWDEHELDPGVHGMIAGMQLIFRKYGSLSTSAEHDEMWIHPHGFHHSINDYTLDERKRMIEYGWTWDGESWWTPA